MIVIDVRNGELVDALTREAAARGVIEAAVVALIGAVDSFTVSTMPADDATKDVITDYEMPAEMHGSGEITDGVAHLHVTMAVKVIARSPGTCTMRRSAPGSRAPT